MSKLDFLDVHFNSVEDGKGGVRNISVVKNMPELIKLDVCSNPGLRSIEGVSELKKLKIFDCSGCSITDFTPVVNIAPEIMYQNLDKGRSDTSIGMHGQFYNAGKIKLEPGVNEARIKIHLRDIMKFF